MTRPGSGDPRTYLHSTANRGSRRPSACAEDMLRKGARGKHGDDTFKWHRGVIDAADI